MGPWGGAESKRYNSDDHPHAQLLRRVHTRAVGASLRYPISYIVATSVLVDLCLPIDCFSMALSGIASSGRLVPSEAIA